MNENQKNFKASVIQMSPQRLTPYMNNTKLHPVAQVDKIAAQIAYAGFLQPIVVDKNHVIISGHGRREAALRLGLQEVPVIVADHLSEDEVKAARIADNKVAESDWDEDKLKFELGTLQSHDFDLKLTGFALKEIDNLFEDDAVENSEEAEKEEEEQQELQNDAEVQFIVSVHCKDEDEMSTVYDELTTKGLECKLIT